MTSEIIKVSEKALSIEGPINELREFAEEIDQIRKGERMDLSNKFSDLLFNICANYQAYHELNHDDWKYYTDL